MLYYNVKFYVKLPNKMLILDEKPTAHDITTEILVISLSYKLKSRNNLLFEYNK